ncbi:MAG: hypothetical protein PX481_00700 [Microcystis sp. M53603_WE2]|uniref:Uncharacterized protein n=1 Tax=Microcystis aeruginosa PCC 9717 TaxID=1160286 RepID=I4FQM9_MICAE|nr:MULTISPECIES: hypothetical protein [unclassified Microcystis]MCZ8365591.1 hypothetical protein [Microcystis sp. LE19-251.1A]MDJ0566173.1 hypothetical protein [Microcystis sp. M49629_WE12]CCH97954.1 conserved hypothetical protein [Microcystis aeruginosa PCC 9717]MCZ8024998.1 hypothetical protein [Microcystis sp. LE19-10.1B]MDJ0537244.1 hypothetical protein [Microcystis sp. M53603_WE2]
MNFTIPIENNLLHHHSGDSETPRLRDYFYLFSPHPKPHTHTHTPHPTPTPQKKELGEKILILRQGFCKATGQHLGILLKCPYHEVDFTTDRV